MARALASCALLYIVTTVITRISNGRKSLAYCHFL